MALFTIGLSLAIEFFLPSFCFGVMGVLGAIAFLERQSSLLLFLNLMFGFTSCSDRICDHRYRSLTAIKVFGARGRWKKLVLGGCSKKIRKAMLPIMLKMNC